MMKQGRDRCVSHATLDGIKAETKNLCLSASVCTKNSGKIGMEPAAVVGLGGGE